ncbi:DUF938 domain-containing protein [Glaciecola siphonariae]|uniref:DUF938 domain-containing protein n=1 Tax=Glaciecola siphonariae TaxID=521012 RepID=A0ABV9LV91_9ALTE
MNEDEIPFSQACENNKGYILEELTLAFAKLSHVLEIGSGTGQHAVHFAKHLPHIRWQTADQDDYHEGIRYWMARYPSENLLPPISLRLPIDDIPDRSFDGFFSANTAHIMQKNEVEFLMARINERLPSGGVFCQYGPFTQQGKFNSQSNIDFHEKLIASGRGGYRDIDELRAWAPKLSLHKIVDMPANNHLLVWHKS